MSIFRRLTEKPWLPADDRILRIDTSAVGSNNRKVALIIFLCVVGSVFFLLIAATHMRLMMATDWVPMPEPTMMWVNSLVLVGVSICFEVARLAAKDMDLSKTRFYFGLAGVATCVFVILQVLVWRELILLGYAAQNNPANAFFYVLTAAHAVHLAGGLIAWWRAIKRMREKDRIEYSKVKVSVDLCAIYWHFLLFIWIIMVASFIST